MPINFFNLFKDSFQLPDIKRLPSKSQWRQFFKFLNKKEKISFFVFLVLFLGSFLFLILDSYFKNTQIRPTDGGEHIEGILGQPRFINPIYSQTSDVDRDLTELIFSGLMKYNNSGEIIPDLAEKYEIKEGGKVFEIHLKENLFWSDSSPLTVDDVIFTIETIQNSDYKSPARVSWLGVGVQKIGDSQVRFSLRNPYPAFLENLTQKIIPRHIWKDVSYQNFLLSIFNLKPAGSGPYKLKNLKQEKSGKIISLDLVRNPKYSGKIPYLARLSFVFFDNDQDLIKSYKKGRINGFSLLSFSGLSKFQKNLSQPHSLSLPRYFAVFFNPEKSKTLAEKEIKQALNYGINKEEIVQRVLEGKGKIVHSPIPPGIYDIASPSKIYPYDPEKARELLQEAGFPENSEGKRIKTVKKTPSFQFKSDLKKGSQGSQVRELQKCLAKDPDVYPEGETSGVFGEATKRAVIRFQEKYREEILNPSGFKEGTGLVSKATRAKLNELCFPAGQEDLSLRFSLSTVNQPALVETAQILKEQWSKIGIEIDIKTFNISELENEVIKPRNYEMLLFGQVLGMIPDPFPFWHSTQIRDPGLNLSLYQNKKIDKLLEQVRQIQDFNSQKEKFETFQNVLIEDAPAVFLYASDYLYFLSPKLKGFEAKIIADLSKRFSDIENWYIETKRVWR